MTQVQKADPSWETLLIAAQQGDQTAYQQFLREVASGVQAFVRSHWSGDLSGVEDIIQEVLLGLHLALKTFQPGNSAKAWVMAIARHKLVDALRIKYRLAKKLSFNLDELKTNLPQVKPEVEGSYEAADFIQNLFLSLSEREKKLLWLFKVEGLTAQEVAKETNLSVSNAKVSLHRALKKIKTSEEELK